MTNLYEIYMSLSYTFAFEITPYPSGMSLAYGPKNHCFESRILDCITFFFIYLIFLQFLQFPLYVCPYWG